MQNELDLFIHTLVAKKDAELVGAYGKKQVKKFAEVTTPIRLIDGMLDMLPTEIFSDLTKTILDPCTGDGRFLMRVLYKRFPYVHTSEDLAQAVDTLYAIELQQHNVDLARKNIVAVAHKISELKNINLLPTILISVTNNIIQGDAIAQYKK